jgi:hypothetical protein
MARKKEFFFFVEGCSKIFAKQEKRFALGRVLQTMLKEQADGTELLVNCL